MTIDTGILCSVNADTSQGVQAFQNFNAAAATTNATVDAGSQSLLNMGKTMEGMASSLQNLSRSQAVANSESDSWIQNMLGISTPMGMLTKGIDIMKSSWVEAKNAVADYQKYAQQITQGGKVGFADANLEVQAIAASTGNLISLTRIATDQNVLQRNAVKLTNKEMELVYKAAVGLSRQTGQSIEEVSQKLTNSIAKGTSETIMEYGLLSQELTGSKSEKIKVIMGTLETGFSNIGMEAQTMGEKAQRSLNMAEMAAISMGKVLEDNVAKGKAFETSLKENLAVTKGWIISTLTGEDIRLDKQGVLAQAIEQTDNLISGFKELSNYEKGLSFLGEEEVDQFAQLEEITQSMVALRKELAMIKRVTDAGDQLSAIQAEAMLKAIIAEEEKRIKQLKERAILLAEEAKRNPDQQGAEAVPDCRDRQGDRAALQPQWHGGDRCPRRRHVHPAAQRRNPVRIQGQGGEALGEKPGDHAEKHHRPAFAFHPCLGRCGQGDDGLRGAWPRRRCHGSADECHALGSGLLWTARREPF